MRYDVDLVNKKEQVIVKDDVKIVDRINDPYLANRLGSYKNISYETLIQNLYKNPLLYNEKINNLKIEYLDDFCFKYQNSPLSLGGLILNKEIKKGKKKKIIKRYFDKNIEEYNKDLNDKISQMDHILNLSDSFNPKTIKFLTFIITLFITLILYLINFPNEKILNYIDLNIMLNKASIYLPFNLFRYISFIVSFITTTYILFYFIISFILSKKFDNTFDSVEELSIKVKKQTKKSFRKIVKHFRKQINIKDVNKYKSYPVDKIMDKKYQLSNIDNLNKKSVSRLSNIKNTPAKKSLIVS
jgi:hypothetical protein